MFLPNIYSSYRKFLQNVVLSHGRVSVYAEIYKISIAVYSFYLLCGVCSLRQPHHSRKGPVIIAPYKKGNICMQRNITSCFIA